MTNTTRRDFIRTSLAAATGATILSGCEAGA
ncbi:MAG: twin-arginine translocation signal domain-containing protein, partial [Gemmatimonadetes bacterium]|nr:twin-arginine translocation signal domain-containing protein [Gemmatimonadota bacterium]